MDSQEIFNWMQSHITGRNMSSQDELWIHRMQLFQKMLYEFIRCNIDSWDAVSLHMKQYEFREYKMDA